MLFRFFLFLFPDPLLFFFFYTYTGLINTRQTILLHSLQSNLCSCHISLVRQLPGSSLANNHTARTPKGPFCLGRSCSSFPEAAHANRVLARLIALHPSPSPSKTIKFFAASLPVSQPLLHTLIISSAHPFPAATANTLCYCTYTSQ